MAAEDDVLLRGDSDDNDAPSSVQDIIRDLNENQGLEKSTPPPTPASAALEPPQPAKPSPAAGQSNAAPPGNPPTPTDDSDSTNPSGTATSKSLPPKDPAFVRGNADQTQPASTEAGKAPENGASPAEDHVVFNRLSEMTSGAIKSEKDFRAMVDRYNELVEEAEKGFQPKFRNERHKLAYDLLANVPEGREIEEARRTLHTLSLDVDKLSPKEKLFEAYLLDPDNADLTRERAWEYFELDYDRRFADAETDKLVERALEKEVRKATETIAKVQKDFLAARESAEVPEGPSDEVVSAVQRAVKGFGGLEMAFSDDASDEDVLRIPEDDPAELQRLQEYAMDPGKWWNHIIEQFQTDKGFDYEGFTRELYELANHRKIKALIYNHGFERGKALQIAKDRNSSSLNKDAALNHGRVPAAPSKEASSFQEAFAKALGENG